MAESVDLKAAVAEAVAALRGGIGRERELDARLLPSGRVRAAAGELQALARTLVERALGSLAGSGRVTVEVEARETPPASLPELGVGPVARLRVRDDGPGLEEEARLRLVSVDHPGGPGAVVRALGGVVLAETSRGWGTTVEVWLPLLELPPAPAPRPPRGSGPRILLVDDEPLVCRAHRGLLVSLGYRVTVATDGAQALELLRASPEGYDLVLTDQVMPGLSGEQLARQWLQERPRARLLLCTGYGEEQTPEWAESLGFRGVVYKPLTREGLDAAVRAALGDDPPAPQPSP